MTTAPSIQRQRQLIGQAFELGQISKQEARLAMEFLVIPDDPSDPTKPARRSLIDDFRDWKITYDQLIARTWDLMHQMPNFFKAKPGWSELTIRYHRDPYYLVHTRIASRMGKGYWPASAPSLPPLR